MGNDEDRKIVGGSDIAFDGSSSTADTLDGVVAAAAPSSDVSQSAGSYVLENMTFLAEQVEPLFGISSDIQDIIPYAVKLVNPTKTTGVFYTDIKLTLVDPVLIKRYLEKRYGSEIAQTGIYEAVGLDKHEPIDLSQVLIYFSEFNSVTQLSDRKFQMRNNSYQYLLALPVEYRAFFAGALKKKNVHVDNNQNVSEFQKPLTLKDILDYAKKVGEVSRVKEYVDVYMGRGK